MNSKQLVGGLDEILQDNAPGFYKSICCTLKWQK